MSSELKTTRYKKHVISFKEWLKTLGYSKPTWYGHPRMLQEFLTWLEQNDIYELKTLNEKHITSFIEYNKTRKNKRREGGVSISRINAYIELLNKFREYIKQTEAIEIPVNLKRLEEEDRKIKVILSLEEVKALYSATDETPHGIRDRAMLSVYYACGLRKSEGINLDVNDILFERKVIYIRKAKNNYERYVPITKSHLQNIAEYIYNARPLLLGEKSSETALFISERGTRIFEHMAYLRIKKLQEKAHLNKEIAVHTLRHSIATHLLQAGMELEDIALFLGHRSLDSTQIYTHIVNEKE